MVLHSTTGAVFAQKNGGMVLDIQPGADLSVVLAIVRVSLENGWQDKNWIETWVNNKFESSSGFGQNTRNTPRQWRTTWGKFQTDGYDDWVIPPFLAGPDHRVPAAAFSFWAGVASPMPRCPAMLWLQTMKGMFGQSLLQAHGHCVAKSWASRWPAGDCLQSSRGSMVSLVSMMCWSSHPCVTVRF
jgi:anaerobic selenocysteine-containing dehydrogenase